MDRKDQSGIDFSSFIRERAELFTGRRWVFAAIHQWLQETSGPRFFLLTGKPGSGKTAIAARLCQFSRGDSASFGDLPAFQATGFLNAYHFCSARDSNWIDPRSFVRSIALQLAKYHQEFAAALVSTAEQTIISAEATVGTAQEGSQVAAVIIENLSLSGTSSQESFNRIIAEPLQNIYQSGFNQPITILVDSLDESLDHKSKITIAGLLSRVKHLPPQVRFILTSRDDDRLSIEFLEDAKVLTLSESDHDSDNNQDIGEYVRWRLSDDKELSRKAESLTEKDINGLVDTIAREAEGNFLYVAFLLKTLAKPQRSLSDLRGLPVGLEGLYYDSIKRVVSQGSGDWTSSYSPIMGVLSVAQAPVTVDQIQQFTAQPANEVWSGIDDLQQFIEKNQVVSESFNGDPVYRLYHQSVIDFLRARQMTIKAKQVNNSYYLQPSSWHLRIAAYYSKGHSDWNQWDDYGVRYLATHLAEAAQASPGSQRHQQVERLVDLVSDRNFQQTHKQRINDLALLQRDLDRSLKAAAVDGDSRGLQLLVKIAMAITAFRRAELRPDPLFELARQGEVDEAMRRLDLFEVDAEWKHAALLAIVWLSAATRTDESRRLRDQLTETLPTSRTLHLLLAHLNSELDNTSLPAPQLPPPPPEEIARELVSNLGGRGTNTELLMAYGHSQLGQIQVPFADGPDSAPGYFAERDAPLLVAYADANLPSGDKYLRAYVSIHSTYNYVQYRNRSLLHLLDAVLQSDRREWVKKTVTSLVVAALAGNVVEFQEGLPLSVLGLRATLGDTYALEAQLDQARAEAAQLVNQRGEGDSWGHFRRRLASLAQLYAVLLGRPAFAVDLLEKAIDLPFGFAGFNAPASLFVAEAIHVCQPGDFLSIQRVLDAALNSAHNIQDAIFCARTTARVNAMRERWWGANTLDVKQLIPRFCQDAYTPEFNTLHRIGEQYASRQPEPQSAALPESLRQADRLSALADAYQRPLGEFIRLNREQGWTAEQPLAPGTEINVPDPGFVSLLSPRFAAEALCDVTLSPAQRVELIQQLVPVAAISPTALDTVLARLLLAARPTDEATLGTIERLAIESFEEGRSTTGPALRPYGIPS